MKDKSDTTLTHNMKPGWTGQTMGQPNYRHYGFNNQQM